MREGKNSGLSLLAALQILLCFQKIYSLLPTCLKVCLEKLWAKKMFRCPKLEAWKLEEIETS